MSVASHFAYFTRNRTKKNPHIATISCSSANSGCRHYYYQLCQVLGRENQIFMTDICRLFPPQFRHKIKSQDAAVHQGGSLVKYSKLNNMNWCILLNHFCRIEGKREVVVKTYKNSTEVILELIL
jgi:hypothetical protein